VIWKYSLGLFALAIFHALVVFPCASILCGLHEREQNSEAGPSKREIGDSKSLFVRPVKICATTSKGEFRSGNSAPRRSCLAWPNRQKSEGAKSGAQRGCRAVLVLFSSKNAKETLALSGCPISAWRIKFRSDAPI
jgi:hypothetical protein